MIRKLMGKFSILMSLTLLLSLLPLNVQAKTITSNDTGTHGGYNYEYWKDSGNGTMVLKDGGAFSCEWNNINNILFRKGLKFDETKTHQQIGNMTLTYECNYQPNGNSYLAVYGWTSDPLVEYYVIESWGTWKPPGTNNSKGTITVDGGVYDIFETTRVQQPSIKGTATFQQYWSVRQQKRTSGTVSVSEHFKAWEAKGMKMGKFYEISLVVEGYQSSGKADVTMMEINIGGNSANPTGNTSVPTPASGSGKSAYTTIEAEDFDSAYGTNIRSIGMGVGYIENGNYLLYKNISFADGANAFKAKVANGNTTATTIQLRLGSSSGTLIGSLSVPSTGGWNTYEELSTTVSGASGTKDLYLCFNGPVNIDSFSFEKGSSTTDPIPSNPGNILLGDVDQNGTINSLDFARFKMYLLGMTSSLPEEGDINRDGSINSIDYAMLKQHLLGIINLEEISAPTPTPTQVVVPTPTKTPSAGTFHCFLLLGQSNMAGWARAQDSDKIPNPRILSLGYDNNQWGVAVPPLHEAWQGAIGPGDWFAKTIIERLPENDTIGLIPCAISGEKIETFMKNGGTKYDWIVSRARMAQQRGGVIEGILFHQGESNNGQSDWPYKVSTLISDLKKDLGLGDIPVLAGELLYSGSCAGHNTLVNRLPSIIPNCYVISAQGLSGDPADFWGLHFNHDSTVEFGKRYAKKMIEVLGW
mgnify:CR=1 FL=1